MTNKNGVFIQDQRKLSKDSWDVLIPKKKKKKNSVIEMLEERGVFN